MNEEASTPAKSHSPPTPRDDSVLDWARDTGAADMLVDELDRYLRRRRRRRLALASTACAALFIAGAIWFPVREIGSTAAHTGAIASATVLRPEQRTLPDGSTVDLKAGAELEVTFSDSIRRVVLRKGEAHFQVARNAERPFVVAAGTIEVRAVGTAFAVELGTSAVDVLVTEGSIAVNATAASDSAVRTGGNPPALPPSLVALEAGKRVVIERASSATANVARSRVSEISPADMQMRLAWRVPRLKFAATPLAQVVAMFNEHAVAGRDAPLVLALDIRTNVRVSGTLRADDVESLLKLLAGEFGILAERRAGEIVLRK
jgi:transmembrane sensor